MDAETAQMALYSKRGTHAKNAHKNIKKHCRDHSSDATSCAGPKVYDVHNKVTQELADPEKNAILQKFLTMKNKLSF
jgi:hypothetical protein